MSLRIERITLWRLPLQTRMPFRYGIATMTHLPHVFVRAIVNVDGSQSAGVAADHLPPKWFTKDPAASVDDEIAEMMEVIETAARMAAGTSAANAFDLWEAIHDRMEAWRLERTKPALLAHFGTSLVERAVTHAVCRAKAVSFCRAIRTDVLGIRLGDIHHELDGWQPADLLPPPVKDAIDLRHTVGLSDPIDARDTYEPLDDGLPQTLAENISAYGLTHFKVKFTGKSDLDRLERTLEVASRLVGPNLRFSLDGNESFATVPDFKDTWHDIVRLPVWRAASEGLMFVEQPFHRSIALSAETGAALNGWIERPPIIIDESDAELSSVRQALGGGYVGTSHKNCKGIFKGVANACLLAKRRREHGGTLLHSGEDLANVGPVALQQDLAAQAALGIRSVERNGHHYFRGLSFLPAAVQRAVESEHPRLFNGASAEFARLTVADGRIDIRSVLERSFGTDLELDFDAIAGEPVLDLAS